MRMRYRFAECVFDVASHTLTRDGRAQKLEPQVFDLLALMIARAGQLVSWDDIVAQVWQGRAISDSTISARVAALRRALGDDGTRQAIIRTVPRRGLMLVADVNAAEDAGSATARDPERGRVVKFTRADDGLSLAYALSGEGPPLLRVTHSPSHLEHDWTDPVDSPLFNALGRIRQLVRYDKRGTGLSETEIDTLDAQTEIEDLRAVADAAELERFDLMGSSGSGVMTAVGFAARYPERVRRLVLHAGCAEGRLARLAASGTASETETIESMIREGWSKPGSPFVAAYLTTYFPGASQAWISATASWMQKSCPPRSVALFRRLMNTHSVLGLLGQVQAPTLVIQSSGDAVHPVSEGRRLAAGIPGAQFRVFDSVNHYILPDEPVWPEFVDAVLEFLDGPG